MGAMIILAESSDPITAVLSRDWASVGGWGLFLSLTMFIVIGSVRETWVPGKRYRRLEESSIKLADANAELRAQNSQLISTNKITEHFFKETTPVRGDTP